MLSDVTRIDHICALKTLCHNRRQQVGQLLHVTHQHSTETRATYRRHCWNIDTEIAKHFLNRLQIRPLTAWNPVCLTTCHALNSLVCFPSMIHSEHHQTHWIVRQIQADHLPLKTQWKPFKKIEPTARTNTWHQSSNTFLNRHNGRQIHYKCTYVHQVSNTSAAIIHC